MRRPNLGTCTTSPPLAAASIPPARPPAPLGWPPPARTRRARGRRGQRPRAWGSCVGGGGEGWRGRGAAERVEAGGGRVEDHGRGEAAFEGSGTAGQGPSERWATHAQPAPHPAPHPAPLGPAGSTSTHPDGDASHSLGARSSSGQRRRQQQQQQAGAAAAAAAAAAGGSGGRHGCRARTPLGRRPEEGAGGGLGILGEGEHQLRAHTHREAAQLESGCDRSNPKVSG